MPKSLITPGRALLLELVLPLKERYPFLPFLMPRQEAALPLLRLLEPVRFSKWLSTWSWRHHHEALGRGPSVELEDLLHEAQSLAEEDPSQQGLMLALRGGAEQRRRQLTRLARALQPLLAAHRYDRSPLMEAAKYLGAADRLARNGFDLIVFGHTHRAKQIRLESGKTYLNCGAWRRMPRLPLPDPDLDEAHLPEMLDEFIALLVEGDLDRWGYDPPTFARIEFGKNHSLTGVYRFEGPDRVTPLLGR